MNFYQQVDSYDDLSVWNEDGEIRRKRKKISDILLRLSTEQDHINTIDIPCISFTGLDEDQNKTDLNPRQEKQEMPKPLLDYIDILKKQQSDFTLIRKYR